MAKKFTTAVLDFMQVIVFAVSIFLFVYLLILQPHKIKGRSMETTFLNGEFLLAEKVTYRFNDPERGDVVIFKAPPNKDDEYIKRIIGIPGDQVRVQGGKIYVNGKQIEERYLQENEITSGGTFAVEGTTITVTPGHYFVVGDNRQHSLDGRNFGLIEFEDITGKAWVTYWPLDTARVVPSEDYGL